jgi:tRNA (mo5U34)-methyltransferase
VTLSQDQCDAIAMVHQRSWFYDFALPDGSRTHSYLPEGVADIHVTRREMLATALARGLGEKPVAAMSAIDIACHQGYFSLQLAQAGFGRVLAIDNRDSHLADTDLVSRAYGYRQIVTARHDVEDVRASEIAETFDVVLMLGLIYHVENPVRILRLARALCRGMCIIETQVVPNMTGVVDWGSWRFQRPMVASFGIIDETEETHGPEASVHGICVTPSYEALVWCMHRVGFQRVERVVAPAEGYEQLTSGKRVMVVGYT